jgi:hypothetical protein
MRYGEETMLAATALTALGASMLLGVTGTQAQAATGPGASPLACNPNIEMCRGSWYPNEHQCVIAKNSLDRIHFTIPEGSMCIEEKSRFTFFYGPRR